MHRGSFTFPAAMENEKETERYGHIPAWAAELGISDTTIANKIKERPFIFGKTERGQVLKFFAETDVRQACTDLLVPLPQADRQGFIEIGGTKYGSAYAWKKFLGIAIRQSHKRLEELPFIEGKDISGRILRYYAENEIRQAYAELLAEAPTADDQGFIVVASIRYGTREAWGREFGVSAAGSLAKRLRRKPSIKGKVNRRVWDFYSETDARSACVGLSVPHQADKEGFLHIDGERYGTVEAWGRILNISTILIKSRLTGIIGVTGKLGGNVVLERAFFAESTVRKRCARDVAVPVFNADGKLEGDLSDERYKTATSWAKQFGVSRGTFLRWMKQVPSIHAKCEGKRAGLCFAESVVRTACAEQFQRTDVPKVDEGNIIVMNDERHATICRWQQELKRHIRHRLKGVIGITGIDAGGHILKEAFLPESIVRERCSDMLGQGKIQRKRKEVSDEECTNSTPPSNNGDPTGT